MAPAELELELELETAVPTSRAVANQSPRTRDRWDRIIVT